VIRQMRDRTRGEWEGALTKAKHRTGAQGGPPCILSYDFLPWPTMKPFDHRSIAPDGGSGSGAL
jgi:hypothetical protein